MLVQGLGLDVVDGGVGVIDVVGVRLVVTHAVFQVCPLVALIWAVWEREMGWTKGRRRIAVAHGEESRR